MVYFLVLQVIETNQRMTGRIICSLHASGLQAGNGWLRTCWGHSPLRIQTMFTIQSSNAFHFLFQCCYATNFLRCQSQSEIALSPQFAALSVEVLKNRFIYSTVCGLSQLFTPRELLPRFVQLVHGFASIAGLSYGGYQLALVYVSWQITHNCPSLRTLAKRNRKKINQKFVKETLNFTPSRDRLIHLIRSNAFSSVINLRLTYAIDCAYAGLCG